MQNFIQYTPTEIVFGRETEKTVGQEVRKWKGSKVLLVYGGGSVVRSGLLKTVEEALTGEGISYKAFGGVQPNPRLSHARRGVCEALDFGADFILAVGGGSVIDTAKGIAHGAANPEADLWDIWTGKEKLTKSLPVGVVLTIAAAGSETSDSAVLTNEEKGRKQGLGTPFNRPKFAIMNPELTYSLPKYQLTCGIVDIMMHTLDRYFTPIKGNEMTDAIAEAVLKTVIANGTKAFENQTDYEPMSEIMWCGSLSHNGITGLGAGREFPVHKMGHELSAKYDVAHGASLSALWGAWARYVYKAAPARFAQYARNVWGVETEDDMAAAEEGIEKTTAYFKALGMPVCFGELEIGVQTKETLMELADKATLGDSIKISTLKPLGKEDVYAILETANHS